MSNQHAAEAAFDALGDPTRRRILQCLRDGARPVGELAGQLPIGRPPSASTSRSWRTPACLEHSARGTRNLYALAPDGLHVLQQWLIALWDNRLQSLADFVATDKQRALQRAQK